MKTPILLLSAAILATTSACTEMMDTASTSSAMPMAMAPAQYVATAGASDLFEIESGRLMQQSTQNPAIRNFANMMVTGHTETTAMVMAAARTDNVSAPPPQLTPAQQDMLSQLRAQTGTARDALYKRQQMMSHQQALAAQQGYAQNGTAPALRAAAQRIAPIVQQHIDMLRTMA